MAHRQFEDVIAERTDVPLMVGLVGPSGSGKTYTGLRLGTGMQRHRGGDLWMVDTEAGRGRHYADRFRYRYIALTAPFSPLDYLAAVRHAVDKGARTILVDSMSHEHEGPGGVLEMHEAEHKRLGGGQAVKMLAWAAPKAARQRMVNTFLQLPVSFIFCFRAKEKLKIEKGKDPQPLGYVAIAGHELLFEMTINMLLLPGAEGAPSWRSDEIGERAAMKLPEQFRGLFHGARGPCTEDHGEALAKWAAGVTKLSALEAEISQAPDGAALEIVRARANEANSLGALNAAEKAALRWAFARRARELAPAPSQGGEAA